MENRRARIIAEVIKHLEDMDGEMLKSSMEPPASMEDEAEVSMEMEEESAETPNVDGPMNKLVDGAGDSESDAPDDEDEMDDEEMEEFLREREGL